MNNEIDHHYIDSAIEYLSSLVGVKEQIPNDKIDIRLHSGNMTAYAENIANHLGLPIRIDLIISDEFQSRQLSTTKSGHGISGITAQVSIPSYIPAYGTPALQNYPITVRVSEKCLDHPGTFACILAHEFSHIILHSMSHPEKDNEFYTDLVAMLLGFSRVMKSYRKTVDIQNGILTTKTTTTTYGYLNDDLFNFAYRKIDAIRKTGINLKTQVIKKLDKYQKYISLYKSEYNRFNKYLTYIDKEKKKNFNKEDIQQIIRFHLPEYSDHVNSIVKTSEENLSHMLGFCGGLVHYTSGISNLLQKFEQDIDVFVTGLKKDYSLLINDIDTLRKYVNIIHRVKLNF